MVEPPATTPVRRLLLECSGACGDLGTFIPHVIGAVTVAGLAPAGVLFGFAGHCQVNGPWPPFLRPRSVRAGSTMVRAKDLERPRKLIFLAEPRPTPGQKGARRCSDMRSPNAVPAVGTPGG